jgi:hypothetical protein
MLSIETRPGPDESFHNIILYFFYKLSISLNFITQQSPGDPSAEFPVQRNFVWKSAERKVKTVDFQGWGREKRFNILIAYAANRKISNKTQ